MAQTNAGGVLPSKVAPAEEQFAALRDLPPTAAAAANASVVDVELPASNQEEEEAPGAELDELVADWLAKDKKEEEQAAGDTNEEDKLLLQESREEEGANGMMYCTVL